MALDELTLTLRPIHFGERSGAALVHTAIWRETPGPVDAGSEGLELARRRLERVVELYPGRWEPL
jgi:hypothetical protein